MADISKEKCIEFAQLFDLKLHHWRLLTGVTSSKDDSFIYSTDGIFPVQYTDEELSKLTAAEQFEIGEFCAAEPLRFPCLPSELLHFIDNIVLGDFNVPDDFREAVEQSMRGPDACGTDSLIDWHNNTLLASMWFGLQSTTPREAAMLLCQFNPNNDRRAPLEVFNTETVPDDYKRLLRVFDDVANAESQPRTLMQWLAIARDKGLKYHSWIDEYINAVTVAQKDSEQSASHLAPDKANPTSSEMGKQSVVTHRIETRTNSLTAVISKASECATRPNDAHSIWAAFVAMAEDQNRPRPLLGYVETEGVKFQDESGVAFITKTNFLRRVRRKLANKNH